MARNGQAMTGVMKTATSMTTVGYARAAAPPQVAPPKPHTSAWTDLSGLEQRIRDAHDLLTEFEHAVSSVLAPNAPTGIGGSDIAEPTPPFSPLVNHARALYAQVDLLTLRLVELKNRVEL